MNTVRTEILQKEKGGVMKKCSRCSKPAILHITEIEQSEVQELHLCESCAQEYLSSSGPPPSTDSFPEKLAEFASEHEMDELDQLVCPNCGITFREFRSQGRLGCPHDYIAFQRELTPLLENIHGETQHAGKFPKRAPKASQRQYRLIKLRSDLRTAIEHENYEAAADLRDQIQTLEAEEKSSRSQDD